MVAATRRHIPIPWPSKVLTCSHSITEATYGALAAKLIQKIVSADFPSSRSSVPSAASHSLRGSDEAPLAIHLPSGECTTAFTSVLCACRHELGMTAASMAPSNKSTIGIKKSMNDSNRQCKRNCWRLLCRRWWIFIKCYCGVKRSGYTDSQRNISCRY